LPTRGNIQLPGSAFANVSAFGYLPGKQTSQRNGTATKYTATVSMHFKNKNETVNQLN
jgi:hypothetical protein